MGSAVVAARAARAADEERLRELTFESKAHWGWALGHGLGSRLFRLMADRARELGAKRLEWGAEPNALGFYEKLGSRKLRGHVTEWGRIAPWLGLDL
jgi:acetyltransferase (GNAT) family protein